MKITITNSQLKQLVKEEAKRYKKVLDLEKQKAEVIQQLNELYENDMDVMETEMPEMEEGMFDFLKSKSPEQKRQEMHDYVQNHRVLSQTAGTIAAKTGQPEDVVLNQLIDLMVREGSIIDGKLTGVKQFNYDYANKRFVNKTVTSIPYGPSSPTNHG